MQQWEFWIPGEHPDIPKSTIVLEGLSGGAETKVDVEGIEPVLRVMVHPNGSKPSSNGGKNQSV